MIWLYSSVICFSLSAMMLAPLPTPDPAAGYTPAPIYTIGVLSVTPSFIVGKNQKDRWTNDVRRTDNLLTETIRQVTSEEL
jgi:hypothetical protein